ncbi:uncharacterized protein LACBIDRAFT_300146 [Laccaria bicolor S238N-H82]|uniref:Predicted protein n=1 Tax=Laccaria bicolor (strain S238N-H82 / ATCC MYA-4686) TaxID=486041 RepID=B0DG51_LACBS|nr:uncharacterized protein LACBIDRAFT_300146 [Laccaria bicolor S238N-H82]EDR06582.1 predicted protein [Laccaria bicolor S238N-H82]|eukprot:XP_001882954.1 predicted protein [Laccaria bicolor S238N-H82]
MEWPLSILLAISVVNRLSGEGKEEGNLKSGESLGAERFYASGPWTKRLIDTRNNSNSRDGKGICIPPLRVPLPWGTAYRPPHARARLSASLASP